MNLEGEIALVSGGSRGIGQAIARELGKQGARVVGSATSKDGAAAIEKDFSDHGIEGRGLVLDVTSTESIDAAVKTVAASYGPPTVLINNAGITRDNLLARMSEDEWSQVIQTNLSSVYRLTKALLRGMMKARHGRIINITSVVAAAGSPGQTNYAAAKAGIIGFSRSLAREVAARNITVNAVAPGFIDTDMTRALNDDRRQDLLGAIPLGRLGEPADIAHAVVFLASAHAGYITGQVMHVNGGLHMG